MMEYVVGFLASFTGFMLVFFFSTSIPQALIPVLIGAAFSLVVLRYYLRDREAKPVIRNYFLMFFLGTLVSSISMFNLLLFVVSAISLKIVWDSKK